MMQDFVYEPPYRNQLFLKVFSLLFFLFVVLFGYFCYFFFGLGQEILMLSMFGAISLVVFALIVYFDLQTMVKLATLREKTFVLESLNGKKMEIPYDEISNTFVSISKTKSLGVVWKNHLTRSMPLRWQYSLSSARLIRLCETEISFIKELEKRVGQKATWLTAEVSTDPKQYGY